MYFTREAQVAPEEIEATRNAGPANTAVAEQANEYDSGMLSHVFSGSPGEPPGNAAKTLLRSPSLSSRSNTGIRVIALSRAQRTQGNRYTQRLVGQIQLNSKPSRPIQRQCACGGTCSTCSSPAPQIAPVITGDLSVVQRQASAGMNGGMGSNGSGSNGGGVIPTDSYGEPLDEKTRRLMEARLGSDFRDVRVHNDQRAAASAETLEANAYTTGRDIYFGAGAYAPSTSEGQHLLAHELAHTIQQSQGSTPTEVSQQHDGVAVGAADDPLEEEAERAADTVTEDASQHAVVESTRHSMSMPPASRSVIQRDGPNQDRIAELRRNLKDDEERAAIDLMGQLSTDEVARVLGDGELRGLAVSAFNDSEMVSGIRNMRGPAVPSLRWLFGEGVDYADFRGWLAGPPSGIDEVLPSDEMRAGFVSACDDEQMAEAVKNLPGKLARKMSWLRAEGVGYREARDVIRAAPAAERVTLYEHDDLRDWFVDICDDILMQNLVQDVGGTLKQKLTWMRAEGSNWTLMRVLLVDASAAEKSQVLDDANLRSFFQETLDNQQMAEAVNLLGGELSQRMEWLQAEGSDVAPAGVRKLPTISPRDRALIETLDLRSELFRLFIAAETADKTVDNLSHGEAAPGDDSFAEARAEASRAHAALDAALRAEGYTSIEGFLDEIRRFEAFFHGFALQTAYAMLAENRQLAEKERDRYEGAGELDAAWEALAPLRARLPAVREREAGLREAQQLELQNPNPNESSREPLFVRMARERLEAEKREAVDTIRPAIARFPILANKDVQDRIFAIAEDRAAVAQLFKSTSLSTIEKIDKVDRDLAADTAKLWQMQPVIDRAKASLGIVEGSAMDGIIKRKLASVQSNAIWTGLVIGALALGLGLLSGGTGAVAVLAAAGALGLSAWGAAEHWEEFQFQTAARGSAIDPAQVLSQVDPSVVWLAVDIIGAFLDLGGLVKAMRGLAGPAKALAVARTAQEVEQQTAALRTAAREAAGSADVSRALKPGVSLETAVARSAERVAARRATLASNPELVAAIRTRAPYLANDEAALAGLARMGREGAEQAMRTLGESPELLRRLAHLADADAALARGATNLQAALGQGAAAPVLRDLLLRSDPSRAQSVLAAAGSGRLTPEQLGRISQAARSADDAGRARAVADAIDRELKTATGVPAPGSQAERDALAATAKVEGEITNPVATLQDEWRFVSRNEPIPIREGDYVAEVALPNGHRWRQNRNGTWCRFTREFCLTPDALAALAEQSDPLARRALQLGEQAALASQHERELPAIIEKLTGARRTGVRQINLEALTQHEREVLEQIFHNREISELTLAELNAARGRIGAEATQLFRQQEEAIRLLGEANIPLYDKLRGSLSERLRSQALNRARGLDQVSGVALAADARAVDHIVSLKQIMEMPGFQRLRWDDQVEIANALENLRVIDRSPNSSRGARSVRDWPQGSDYYNQEALQRMAQEEEAARAILQQRINERLARSGQRPP